MAHRLYVYNINSKTGEQYPYYLGEWNYEIPELLLPLFSCDPRAKGKLLYFDKINGVERLKSFYQLLGEHYQLLYKKAYYEPVNKMFEMLDNLPYDTFVINGWDVFNMSDEKHSDQARNWVFEIKERSKLYDKAMAKQNLGWLEKEIVTRSGYGSFLEMLETDWIDYGLGYWNEDLYKDISETFEDNGLWGLKDKKGNIITPPVYEEIFAFSEEGIAVAQKNGKYGYLRNDGKVLIECIYEEAYDSLFIGNKNYGIIEIDQKCGLLNIETGEIVIPCEYEDLEMLRHIYLFNAKKEDKFYLIDVSNKRVIEEGFDEPFEFNYSGLVYRSLKGTSKKAFYTFEGVFLGEHPEDVLSEIGEGYYWVKPNKFQKKISIIKSDGSLLDTEIDTIMLLDYYTSFAYRKAKKWYIYDIKSGEFRLQTHTIENIHRDWFVQFMKNVFLLSDENGWGLYNAAEDSWLLPSSKEYKKIESCREEIFRVTTSDGMFYFDQKTDTQSSIYDYIGEGIEYNEQMLCLYKGEQMFILDTKRQLHQVSDNQLGALYEKRHNLRGKDQKYFLDFYKGWTERKGAGYEKYFDDATLMSRAEEYINEGKIEEAVRLYEIGVSRGNTDMMVELGYIYVHDDYPEFYDLEKGLALYEKAAAKNHAIAWNNLGYHYQNGIGYPQDIKKALKCFKKSAESGEGLAMQNLGLLYFYGEYVLQDYDLALEYYKQAEKKFYFNDEKIAEIYYQKSDYDNLQRYLRKDKENTYSNIYYGIMYDEGLGVKMNSKKAIKYYEKSLEYAYYTTALSRLLYFYKEDPAFADPEKYQYWKRFGEENDMEL
ncbi:SEL1-like repeat protein [Chryseobacterium gallinarum]|uniref:SEL1-like repeat protein n=1 Tax=Chryseobacterium gallinarum TaxID=1324352 RepID=A0ABX6KMS2_CHRGL|nr:SEL1-like repeat protein [Chryseobacterium gallinarum]QIY89742.1 SEL1-like repeat protein [Chryseobacterium gallinarum]